MRKVCLLLVCIILLSCTLCLSAGVVPVQADTELKPYVDSVEQSQKGMTLWQLIKTGGFIMIALAVFSMAALACTVYNFMNLNVDNLVPREFTEDIIQKLRTGKVKIAEEMSRSKDNIISSIVLAGLERRGRDMMLAKEAMENTARNHIARLWQNISYLSDIATVAPMLGLLGTVLGMIQAFNVIAFQTAVVKPILLAGGVSKAMVTTAGGLIVAIPAMIFYSYFRAKVQEISGIIEGYTNDITKIVGEA